MDITPYGPPPGGFRGDGTPFLVQHVDGRGPSALAWTIFALVLALLLIAIASLAMDAYYRHRDRRSASDTPPPPTSGSSRVLAVLDDRYARGEIARDDYLRARDDLRGATEATTEVIPPEPEPA